MKRYKKLYEKETGKEVPVGFDLHHIDEDKGNNDILNLVAIPKKLHQKYHSCTNIPRTITLSGPKSSFQPGRGFNNYLLRELTVFIDVVEEINLWIDFRDVLLNRLPYAGRNVY